MVQAFYTFIVAVLNLWLGFAVAVCLARRYKSMPHSQDDGWAEVDAWARVGGLSDKETADEKTADEKGADEEDADEEAWFDALAANGFADLPSDEAPNEESALDVPPKMDPDEADSETPGDALPPDDTLSHDPAANIARERSENELSVEDFQQAIEQYGGKVTEIDGQLRRLAESPDPGELKSCFNELSEVNSDYSERQQAAYERLEEHRKETEHFDSLHDDIRTAMARAVDRIDAIAETLDSIDDDDDGNLDQTREAVAEQTTGLIDANHRTRDVLTETLTAIASMEGWLDEMGGEDQRDSLTGLSDLASLHRKLSEHWRRDPHRTRSMAMALIDVDEFARVNAKFGTPVGDRVLGSLGKFLAAEMREHGGAFRVAGETFALFFSESDLRFATDVAERIRQSLELTSFQYHDSQFRVTVSCGVTEAQADDSLESLISRLKTTVHEAKRYGRNRTFLHDGKFPTPVVPPNVPLEERQVAV